MFSVLTLPQCHFGLIPKTFCTFTQFCDLLSKKGYKHFGIYLDECGSSSSLYLLYFLDLRILYYWPILDFWTSVWRYKLFYYLVNYSKKSSSFTLSVSFTISAIKQLSSVFMYLLPSNLDRLKRRNELEKMSTSKKTEPQSAPTHYVIVVDQW